VPIAIIFAHQLVAIAPAIRFFAEGFRNNPSGDDANGNSK
jgi:hypothetical protein